MKFSLLPEKILSRLRKIVNCSLIFKQKYFLTSDCGLILTTIDIWRTAYIWYVFLRNPVRCRVRGELEIFLNTNNCHCHHFQFQTQFLLRLNDAADFFLGFWNNPNISVGRTQKSLLSLCLESVALEKKQEPRWKHKGTDICKIKWSEEANLIEKRLRKNQIQPSYCITIKIAKRNQKKFNVRTMTEKTQKFDWISPTQGALTLLNEVWSR